MTPNNPVSMRIDHGWLSQTRPKLAGDAKINCQLNEGGASRLSTPNASPLDTRLTKISADIDKGSYLYLENCLAIAFIKIVMIRLNSVLPNTININIKAIKIFVNILVNTPMVRSPVKGWLVKINHRSRNVVVATRMKVVKQFYLGDLITQYLVARKF